jgi:hypothetical protein
LQNVPQTAQELAGEFCLGLSIFQGNIEVEMKGASEI